jgi:FkbM family methyltransferase
MGAFRLVVVLLCVLMLIASGAEQQTRRRKRRPNSNNNNKGDRVVQGEDGLNKGVSLQGKRQFKHTPRCNKLVGIYRTLDQLESQCGYSPKAVLDIGANSGDWSNDFSTYFPQATFFLIEATEIHRPTLIKQGFPFEIALVGDKKQKVKFYTNANTGNTIFRQYNVASNDPEMYEERNMFTIDDILSSRNASHFDFMKIDIQGAELLALKGATETLKSVEVLTVEASILTYNVGGVTFTDLNSFLDNAGFALYDIFDMMRTSKGNPGFLVQVDLLFVRKTSSLWSQDCTGIESRDGSSNKDGSAKDRVDQR